MTLKIEALEWSHVRTLIAVIETGSLSGAARQLGLTQPTVGRHVQTMEATLNVSLFTRRSGGMEPTALAMTLLAPAKAMQDAANALKLTAAGAADVLSGSVRITSSVFMAHHVMPAILARLRREIPDVSLELVPSDTTENLLFREADIAVRMVRPEQLDVVTRHLGDITLGLYASQSYLDHKGTPKGASDIMSHDFVGYDRNEDIVKGFKAAGYEVTRAFFKTRCDHQTTYWELVRAGCGLGFGQRRQAELDDDIVELDFGFPLPSLPVWLTAPSAIRYTPAVDRVWQVLSEELTRVVRSNPP